MKLLMIITSLLLVGGASAHETETNRLTSAEETEEAAVAHGWPPRWALILTEIVPEHTDAILQRGYEFGQSRIICNVHWQSDVDAGRIMGAAAVARLHADAGFIADLAQAKAEAQALRFP